MICRRCHADKPDQCFREKKRSDGQYRIFHTCRECENASGRVRHKKRPSRAKRNLIGILRPKESWPWPPGTKVFEDVILKDSRRRAA